VAGRKVFTSGEILTAADVNSFLMDQSVMVFADSSARSSAIPSPSEGMVTFREDANRVEVYDGSSFGPIGGILQVVSATKTDTFSASLPSGGTTAITGLSASITLSSVDSKVLVLVNVNGSNVNGSGDDAPAVSFQVKRDGTLVGVGDSAGSRTRVSGVSDNPSLSGAANALGNAGANFLDLPSSTSALTYTVEVEQSVFSTTSTVHINRSPGDSDGTFAERSASTITLMEVAV